VLPSPYNKAWSGQVGFCAVYRLDTGFGLFLLSGIIPARQPVRSRKPLGGFAQEINVAKKLITKAIQTAIDNHCDFVWIQDHLRNIFLCRYSFHENGREITRKLASFYIPEELERAIELHHAVFDAVKDQSKKPLISTVLGNFMWNGTIEAAVYHQELERERNAFPSRQENFYDAVANDTEMTDEQKEYWLSRRPTKHAPDVVDSGVSNDISPASEVPASEAESTPATTQVM